MEWAEIENPTTPRQRKVLYCAGLKRSYVHRNLMNSTRASKVIATLVELNKELHEGPHGRKDDK